MSSVLLCSCFLRCLASFLLSLKRSLHLARRSKKNHLGEKCQKAPRGPTGWQARELKKERKTERCASVCVREKTTGWRRTPPTVAREREKHSRSLFGLLSHSHPPLLSRSPDSAWMPHQPHSLSLSPPSSVLAACRSRNWEAVPNDWSSEVCEMWINWQNLSFSLHKWNH